ncbi:13478_t:CDS:2, partial [Cetraspora pellucida]
MHFEYAIFVRKFAFKSVGQQLQRILSQKEKSLNRNKKVKPFIQLNFGRIVAAATIGGSTLAVSIKLYRNFAQYDVISPDKFIPLTINKITPINHNTSIFRLKFPKPLKETLPITSCFHIKDDSIQIVREYTPISPTDERNYIEFLIKRYNEGHLSRYIHSLKEGNIVEVRGPILTFPYTPNMKTHIGMICGGFDRKIILWDIVECRPSSGISSINLVDYERPPIANPTGTVIASGSPEKVVRLWDPRTTKQITSFTGHTNNYIKITKFQAQNLLMQQQRHQPNDYRRELQDDRSPPPQHISFPPATIQVPTTPPTVATTQNVNSPPQSTSALPQSPTTPLAAFTGPLTAPATTGSQQSDYFTGSHHNSPTSPTSASGNVTPPGSTGPETLSGQLTTSEVIKPPPPALLNQTSSSSGSSSSIFGRLKPPFGRKISRGPNTEAKPESSGTNMSTEKNADAKTDSTLAASTQSQDESSAQNRKDEESKANSTAMSKVQMQHIGDSNRYHPIQHDPIHSIRNIRPIIQPPFVPLSMSETPEVQIPPHTTVIISEVSPEASTFVDSYRGAIESMEKDV